jgi:hypothetical protein
MPLGSLDETTLTIIINRIKPLTAMDACKVKSHL